MLFRRLIVALFAGLLLLAPAAVAAGPYPPPPDSGAEVDESRVEAGGCVIFTGHGFEAFTTITIRDNGEIIGVTQADSQGRFRFRVCFDADSRRGPHTLTGTGIGAGGSGLLTVSATVLVTGVSQRPGSGDGSGGGPGSGGAGDGNGAGNGDGDGAGLPHTGFQTAGVALGGIALVAVGSAVLLITERRHRSRRRLTSRSAHA